MKIYISDRTVSKQHINLTEQPFSAEVIKIQFDEFFQLKKKNNKKESK